MVPALRERAEAPNLRRAEEQDALVSVSHLQATAWPHTEPCVPKVVVEIEFEGRVRAAIRCVHGGEEQAQSMRAWLESDPELAEFCELVRHLTERMAA